MTSARATNHLDGTPRYFGFKNPNPMLGSPNYGYEQWMTVEPDAELLADVETPMRKVPAVCLLVLVLAACGGRKWSSRGK